ncbi:MAG: efflux RND transporter periplasmic adaptor subunit [Pseudomonadota bacterium]
MRQIKVAPVEARSFWDEKTAVGQIMLNEDVTTPIFAPYAGRVSRLVPKPGDAVKKGDPLFEINSPDLVQAESTLISAAATQLKARSQLDLTTRSLARQRELFQAKATAQKDLEQADADQRNAESDFRGATGALNAAQDAVRIFGKTDAEIAHIREQRRIDPVMAVFAPIGGTVVARKAGPGQYVQPSNADPVYVIADLSKMWLVANVAELDIPFVHLGDEVAVKVAAYPKEVFHARITNIGASVDPTTRRVTVRSELEPQGFQLKPQMFASFRIITEAGQPSPAVPIGALTREGDKSTLWVRTGPRQFAARHVERGLDQEGMAQILSGLSLGETVVTEGGVYLSNVGVPGG